jgi:enoyl-CoA hydratase/carnithine racemase
MHEMLGSADTLSTAERTFDRLGIGRETLAVKNFDKPLIAAVNGAAAGGGFALAMLHDIRLASERATFTSAFVRIGLVAEMGLSYTLPRAIGLEAAMDVMFTGRSVSADEALAIGMVRHGSTKTPPRAAHGRGHGICRTDRGAGPDRSPAREAHIGAFTRQPVSRSARTGMAIPSRRL